MFGLTFGNMAAVFSVTGTVSLTVSLERVSVPASVAMVTELVDLALWNQDPD